MLPVETRWTLAEVDADAETAAIPALARRLGVPLLVARCLWIRELGDPSAARSFLQPRLAELTPPGGLPDAPLAADRLARAVRRGERIAIFGDYDVDGMTGTSLLVRFLRLAGGDVIWSVPDRSSDGYGLSPGAADRLADAGAKVLVTVDNGISAHAAVERATARGVDVVVTDHHLPGERLPGAFAVVDPHRRDAGPLGRDLCGCGLAFKMAWGVAERLRDVYGGAKAEVFRAFLRDAMGLVALATISDVVPLAGENRILVTAGLASLRASEHPGIRSLLETCRLGALPLTTEDVAFRIAPRLNAAGRISRPDLVIDLLTSEDAQQSHRLARQLADANAERRRIEKDVLLRAAEQAQDILDDDGRSSLVVHGDGWHLGVIGIVAARLVDRHHRPTVVIGFDGDEGRGSCRTPAHVNLHTALTRCDAHLSRYGGHAAAAGLEIARGRVGDFTEAFEEAVRHQIGRTRPLRTIRLDGEATADDFHLDLVQSLLRLQPFGAGNPEPQFLLRGARVAGRPRLIGQDGAHLTFALKQSAGAIRVVGFRKADAFETVAAEGDLDLVVSPMLNEWRGVRTAELRLVDLRPASTGGAGQRGGGDGLG